jgi:DNA-binding NarL/FixJ family response regulator
MRYATFVIEAGADLHPADRAMAAEPTVQREAIDQINLLDDGTVVTLYRVRGGLDRMREVLTERPDVLVCDVSGEREGLAYVRFHPTATVERLLTAMQEHEIVLDVPIKHTESGGLRVTVVGEDEALRRVGSAFAEVVAVSLERTGEYRPDLREFSALLTERQREILAAAVAAGYYRTPREATHADVAQSLDLSAGTVGEHLRKIEARVLPELVT